MFYLKIIVQFLLKVFPKSYQFRIYEFLTFFFKKSSSSSLKQKRIEKAISHLVSLNKKGEFICENKTILEFGTGWHCIDILIFWLSGAKRIYTVDHNLHVTKEQISLSFKFLIENDIKSKLVDNNLVSEELITKRQASLQGYFSRRHETIFTFFEFISAKFIKRESCLIEYADIESQVDLFYSESTLQRIPWDDLVKAVEVVSILMGRDGLSFHKIDQSDINAMNRISKRTWHLDYLKYSDTVFNKMCGATNYQNRMRESDFLALFEHNVFKRIWVNSLILEEDIEKLRSFKLAKRFANYKINDLAVHSSTVLYQKG